MAKHSFFLLAILLSQTLAIPLLPEFYMTKIQANINLEEKSLGAGLSYAFDESVWGDSKASLRYKVDGNDGLKVNGQVIWNPEIGGVKNFLDIIDFYGVQCVADSLSHNPILGALFDVTGNTFPSIGSMLYFGNGDHYVDDGDELINGIPCKRYKSDNVKVEALNATFHVRYFWTDATVWTGTSGPNKTIPVLAQVEGEYYYDGKGKRANMYFEFSDFREDMPDPMSFMPPSDLWCQNREMDVDLPGVPEFFSYTSESVFFHSLPNDKIAWILTTRQESYDFFQKVSRSDYNIIDLANIMDPTLPRKDYYVNEVKDFKSQIMYQVWSDFGNCSIKWVGNDFNSDVSVNADGTVSMTGPFEVFYMDKKFALNGRGYSQRGFDMEAYVTQQVENYTVDGSRNMTIAVYLSSSLLEVEGDHQIEYRVPTKVMRYPTGGFLDIQNRQIHNIVGFRNGEPDFRIYDITPCFHDYQMSHRMIRTGWDPSFIVSSSLKVIQNSVRKTVMEAAKITPLRVQNIELYEQPEDKMIYIIFTILDFPREHINGVNVTNLPDEVKLALPEALMNLEKVVKDGALKIELPRKDGSFGAVLASDDFFQEVERPYDPSNNGGGAVVTKNSGYSAGSMAGLAFGMIFLGFAISGLLYVLILRPKARSQMPTMRGFDNPLHGSVNLAKP